MNQRSMLMIALLTMILIIPISASSLEDSEIPTSLQPWKAWVLDGLESRFCPTPYNNGNNFICAWPSRLKLDLNEKGGDFSQQWTIFNKGWFPLPGRPESWPVDVMLDGTAAPVTGKGNVPYLFMEKGKHIVSGHFRWDGLPEIISIPEKSGLISLFIDGNRIQYPLMDNMGRLWLRKRGDVRTEEDRLDVKIFRHISDDIPMIITNLIKVSVSGQAREIRLENVFSDGFIPMNIKSPLPARISDKGEVMIQARPGRWEIRIITRSSKYVDSIGPVHLPFGREVWVFESQNHLRMVEIHGVSSIDPKQTDLPSQWKNLPAFLIDEGNVMEFKEIRRGDPEPAPDQINIHRTYWLDFDGKGLTIKDNITGTMSRQWFLAMNPPAVLGRVAVDGIDQLITSHGKDKKPGVELRKGRLNLTGESRLNFDSPRLSAVGWDHNLKSLSGQLNLPPGWRLFAVRGVDVMPGTWFDKWTLLDLFLVLIISITIFRLWSLSWGLVTLVTLVIIFHEINAPKQVFIHILAATALLRFLPQGWIRRIVEAWRIVSVVILLVIVILFMLQQARWGLYPQLEPVKNYIQGTTERTIVRQVQSEMRDFEEKAAPSLIERRPLTKSGSVSSLDKVQKPYQWDYYDQSRNVLVQDPDALIQTGPGLPEWKWHSYGMRWNGPVDRNQQIRLWLLSPGLNLVLAFIRIILLALLCFCLMDVRNLKFPSVKNMSLSLMILMFLLPGFARAETGFPPREILDELRNKLLEKPECFPYCAEIPSMELIVNLDEVRIILQAHATVDIAIPLPGSSEMWRPDSVILDSESQNSLVRDKDGTLWMLVPEGIHNILLSGGTLSGNEFQIPLPMKPRKVSTRHTGWEIQGIDRNGMVEGSIKLIRTEKKNLEEKETTAMILPPFLSVERVLSLGLEWQVFTKVRRITPPGNPVIASIPLIAGESVTSAGIRVEKGTAIINMAPNVNELEWQSTLTPSETIFLKAPESVPWTETWILDASPIWHCELSGINLVHHQDKAGQWRPEWRPWQGEEVTIKVTRPKAIPGQVVTIDNSNLIYTPGKRINRSELTMQIRSSQGGRHRITIPDGAELQQVRISGKSQPISQIGSDVTIPIKPGTQTLSVEWQQQPDSAIKIKGPDVAVGQRSVNSNVVFQMPRNRWILFVSGPRLGPAVLFWTYLVVVILAGIGLGRISWTPLKTRHWLLLGLGLTQVHPLTAIMIVGWFLAIGIKRRSFPSDRAIAFNASQLLLIIWFIAAMVGLWFSIKRGLLGIPDMQITGNGSNDFLLHWTQDRTLGTMPRPWVFSFHIFVFKGLMLLWALWLSYSLILKWLPWAWECFSEGGFWRKMRMKKRDDKQSEQESNAAPPPLPGN